MDWDGAQAFLAVLREGSLSGGARALGLAQPTVRHRIDALERALGVALFTRSPGGLAPTDTALALAGQVEAMAHAADAMARLASGAVDRVAGTVRLSASEVIAVEVLPSLVARLRVRHPDLVLALSPTNRNEDVLRREADIAVRMVPPGQDGLAARRIGAVEIGLFAHADHLARTGMPRGLADVAAAGLIGLERDTSLSRALLAQGSPLARATMIFRSDNHLAHLAALRAGVGFGLCQVPLAARDPALVRLFPDEVRFPLDLFVVTHEDLRAVPRIRAVLDALWAHLRAYLRPGRPGVTLPAGEPEP